MNISNLIIILTCNQYKNISGMFNNTLYFHTKSFKFSILHYSISQFGLVPIQTNMASGHHIRQCKSRP